MNDKSLYIDGIDKIILEHLTQDARAPILGIAREVGISGAAIHQRLRKLKKSGLLKGSQFIIDPKVLGYKTLAFVGIFLSTSSNYKEAILKLEDIPEIIESHYTTGNYSIFIKLLCKDNEHLMQILNKKIQLIKGVARTETFISLDQHIDRQIGI
ncbi:MAG TPA: AsnC family transcriptional regulator [Lutibacter sp.]|nr:AsnC family transcriptional regulator [Lutibacter sp.]